VQVGGQCFGIDTAPNLYYTDLQGSRTVIKHIKYPNTLISQNADPSVAGGQRSLSQ